MRQNLLSVLPLSLGYCSSPGSSPQPSAAAAGTSLPLKIKTLLN